MMEMPDFIYVLPSYEGNEYGFYDLDPRDGDKYHHSRAVKSLQAEIADLKAKLAKTEWQPIETAPMDGTRIITCCMSPSEYTSVKAGFMAINGYDDRILSWPLHNKVHFPATHWMPLPEPPTTEEAK